MLACILTETADVFLDAVRTCRIYFPAMMSVKSLTLIKFQDLSRVRNETGCKFFLKSSPVEFKKCRFVR